jgi:hypothetical protein
VSSRRPLPPPACQKRVAPSSTHTLPPFSCWLLGWT